jgi:uncharacterized protein (DUF302 family)
VVPSHELMDISVGPEAVVQALRAAIRARGITQYAVVDHRHDMSAAGHPGHVAWTLVFGNPAAGAALLDRDLGAAVDIPLRLAVIGRGPGESAIVIRPMETLLAAEHHDLAGRLTTVLRELAAEARDTAPRGR